VDSKAILWRMFEWVYFKYWFLLLGPGILKFFQTYEKAAHHLFYSLLIGRTVVIVGRDGSEHKASHIMNILSPYVPVMPGQEVKILRYVLKSQYNKILYNEVQAFGTVKCTMAAVSAFNTCFIRKYCCLSLVPKVFLH
jgi:hypothetical protein